MSSNEEKTILVTGGSGFIGRYLVDFLLNQGRYIKIISRNSNKIENTAKTLFSS